MSETLSLRGTVLCFFCCPFRCAVLCLGFLRRSFSVSHGCGIVSFVIPGSANVDSSLTPHCTGYVHASTFCR